MAWNEYLAELKKIQLLPPEEEKQLWQSYKQHGDLECRRQLIEHYQPLVFKAAMRYRADDTVLMDIVQEGTVGLIEAVESYDAARGVAFSLFSLHRIRGRIVNYLERESKLRRLHVVCLDSPLGDGENAATLADHLEDTGIQVSEQAERNYLLEQVRSAMGRLPDKEQLVLCRVYLNEQEPRQIAESMNMSLSHIYRLQKQGIRRIRGMLSKLMCEMKKL